jgi:uracil-DNA glycosylase family 4
MRYTLDHGCSGCPWQPRGRRGWCGGEGPRKTDLVIVGEGPGDTETVTGRPFTGKSGQLLNATLANYGIKRSECYVANSVMCNIKPKTAELVSCRPRLVTEITEHEPTLVLALGKIAFQQLCQTRESLGNVVGTLWWVPDIGAWVLPTWHPAAALRSAGYFPDIANAIWRVSRFLSGAESLPEVDGGKARFPWTFFRTAAGTKKAIRYYQRRAEVLGQITLALDTESRSPGRWPHPESDEWLMLQLYDGKRGAAFQMNEGVQDESSLAAIRTLLTNRRIIWTMHNGAVYDCRVLRYNLGVCPDDTRIRDTLVLGLGMSERAAAVGLEPLARTWLNAPAYKKTLKTRGYKHAIGPKNAEQWKALARYGVEDVYFGWHLNRVLPPMVRDEGTMWLCQNVLMPLAMTCGRIAGRGFPVDVDQANKLQGLWGGKANEYTTRLQDFAEEVGWPLDPKIAKAKDGRFNPRSHIQLAHLAYDVLGLSGTDGTTNRKYTSKWDGGRSERSVDQDFLMGHEDELMCQLMSRLRIYDKLMRTYVKTIQRELELDGLIHPDFRLASTVTGRLVVRPLLQVLPHYGAHSQLQDEDFAQETRRMFPARKGYVIVSADFKQLEMRIAWALSGDARLGEALNSGDVHARTAAYMFRKPESEVTDGDRHAAKRVSFGVAYNRTAFTLARGPLLEVTDGSQWRAQQFIDDFWKVYSDYYAYHEWCKKEALRTGELETPFHRKRRWMLVTDETKKSIENEAVNFPIQSTASDMCSLALVRLEKELTARKLGFPLYTVHDEVVCELKISTLAEGIACLHEIMEDPPIDVGEAKFPIDVKWGPNLGDLQRWTGVA